MIDTVTVVLCSVFMALPLLAASAVLIRSKLKFKRVTVAVEFYPPKGFSPIDVMTEYYAERCNPKALINPLMLYWAANGYIRLEEDCRRGLKLTKLKELDPPKTGDAKRLEAFRLEQGLFDMIFGGGKVFYTLTARSSYKEYYGKFVNAVKAVAKRVTPQKWTVAEIIISAASVIAVAAVSFMLATELDNAGFVAMLFPIMALIMLRAVPLGVFKYLFFGVWGGVPMVAVLSSLPFAAFMITLCSVAASFITQYVLLPLADLREPENLRIYARLKGFKTFLVKAEKPQLEMLVEENPNYYFDILPYCYVFGITKKVRAKFDKIRLDGPAPYLESGEFGDYRDVLMF